MTPAGRGLVPRPVVFWSGVALCTAGVGEEMAEFLQAASMHFRMAGMAMGMAMWAAMAATVAGLVLAGCGLLPRARTGQAPSEPAVLVPSLAERATARRKLIAVLTFALVIDQAKPATLAFIEPGMRAEYHLSAGQVALLPMVALTGTVAGSLLWGHMADRIGRRAAVLMAALLFVATTVCGAMPTYSGNLAMCAMMGLAAGGMLPIVYALMSEMFPARRSGVLVLQAGLSTVAGYLAASGMAALFLPLSGWRTLWFTQLPFVMMLLAANHWIPESPAFLMSRGRAAEAAEMIRRFGVSGDRASASPHGALSSIRDYLPQTGLIGGYAMSWGVVYWGFLTFLPTILGSAALGVSAPQLLFASSLLSVPGTLIAARLYTRWSSRKTLAACGALTVVSLAAFTVVPVAHDPVGVAAVLIGLLTGASTVVAVLGPYAAQLYPAAARGIGSGFAAACGKAGGMFGPPAIAWLLGAVPFGGVAAVVAAPMAVAVAAVATQGKETTRPDDGGEAEEDTRPALMAG